MDNQNNVFFNLSFDDIHPESSKDGDDCGGDMNDGVFGYFLKLWELFPDVKITLFVTPNWIDKANDRFPLKQVKMAFGMNYSNQWDDQPYLLTKHMDWCKWLNSFKNIEIAVHGYNHHTNGRFHSKEFDGMDISECKRRLEESKRIFKEAKLRCVNGFRPPGWGISEGLFGALNELKYDFISLDPVPCKLDNLSRYTLDEHDGLMNVPSNWDIASGTMDGALKIADKYGLLTAKGHISDSYDGDKIGNGLNEITFRRICELLDKLKDRNVSFLSMNEISRAMA